MSCEEDDDDDGGVGSVSVFALLESYGGGLVGDFKGSRVVVEVTSESVLRSLLCERACLSSAVPLTTPSWRVWTLSLSRAGVSGGEEARKITLQSVCVFTYLSAC